MVVQLEYQFQQMCRQPVGLSVKFAREFPDARFAVIQHIGEKAANVRLVEQGQLQYLALGRKTCVLKVLDQSLFRRQHDQDVVELDRRRREGTQTLAGKTVGVVDEQADGFGCQCTQQFVNAFTRHAHAGGVLHEDVGKLGYVRYQADDVG